MLLTSWATITQLPLESYPIWETHNRLLSPLLPIDNRLLSPLLRRRPTSSDPTTSTCVADVYQLRSGDLPASNLLRRPPAVPASCSLFSSACSLFSGDLTQVRSVVFWDLLIDQDFFSSSESGGGGGGGRTESGGGGGRTESGGGGGSCFVCISFVVERKGKWWVFQNIWERLMGILVILHQKANPNTF